MSILVKPMAETTNLIEEKIIEYLSVYPRRNALRIKQGLGEPYGKYSILKALPQMTKKGWLTYTVGRGEKKVIVKFYRLSSLGIGIALAKNPPDKLLKTLECYEESIPEFQTLSQLARKLKPRTALKLLRVTGRNIMRDGAKEGQPNATILSAINGLEDLSKSELEDLVTAATCFQEIIQRKTKFMNAQNKL